MRTNRIYNYVAITCVLLSAAACSLPSNLAVRNEKKNAPANFNGAPQDSSANTGKLQWREYFTDQNLIALIDTALRNNQELNITLQEINISTYEIRARKGEYLPFLGIGAAAGVEKAGRYTRRGAFEETTEVDLGKENPEAFPDYMIGLNASWEVDIWKKLRNAKKAAVYRYLSSVEGKNFMVTNLIAEIANSYYELMAFDNQLTILRQNIGIQTNALEIVRMEKNAARVTELAVRRFEAEVAKNQSRQYYIEQSIIETENHINFLVGRFPQHIQRNSDTFTTTVPTVIQAGIPSQLLANRPDIRQAEQDLAAAKIDVKVAKANFYPSLRLTGGLGYNAFRPQFLLQPQSMMYTLAGELMAPLVNRNAIKAFYYSANARQIQSVYNYERTVLNGYIEVVNQLSNIDNLAKSYDLKTSQVQALTESITISTRLFRSARADYMEVLLTQRDAVEARFELIDTKMQQMHAMVNVYRALGGGWN